MVRGVGSRMGAGCRHRAGSAGTRQISYVCMGSHLEKLAETVGDGYELFAAAILDHQIWHYDIRHDW